MFQLTAKELDNLRSQIATSSWGGRRYLPRAFTEQGVAMLSSVLRSRQAVRVNIAIIRTFVRLRQVLATHEKLAQKVAQHDQQIGVLFQHVKALLEPPILRRGRRSALSRRERGRRGRGAGQFGQRFGQSGREGGSGSRTRPAPSIR
jgi:hypothetical protein